MTADTDRSSDSGAKGARPRISAVMCTLNEEGNLPGILPRIPSFVDELLLIDGHSTDRTVEVARQLRPDIRVLFQPNGGKGDALRHGLANATGDIIVTLDADGATDPDDMWGFIQPLLDGYDMTKGSRFVKGLPPGMRRHRVLGNWLLAVTGNILYRTRYTDVCSGYLGISRGALDQLDWQSLGPYDYEVVLIFRAARQGLRIKEVGHADRGRETGHSKMPSWHTGWQQMKVIWRERFRRRRHPKDGVDS
ncbi:MAG: glycosyltransferase family 2 protein [Chloroflexi bacterium]|nr:glycosyltransferase family 2 protein [Chloroflexota bacterium]